MICVLGSSSKKTYPIDYMAKAMQIPTFIIFSPYLNKKNWFGKNEAKKHVALHLSDFITYLKKDLSRAKEDPKP